MTTMQVQYFETADGAVRRSFMLDASELRRRYAAAAVALLAFGQMIDAKVATATTTPMATDAVSCEAVAATQTTPTSACLMVVGQLVGDAHRNYLAGDLDAAKPYLDQASLIAPQDLRVALEQAMIDAASGHPLEARKRFDVLRETSMVRQAAVPSAVNLAVLGRFDDARKAFMVLTGSTDATEAGNAQLWLLWLDARTWRGDAVPLREKLARDTVGLRAGNAQQQALLNLYAGQGSVDAVFAAIEASTPANSEWRRGARTEAALFAGGYLQHALGKPLEAQRLYRRELPQSGGSIERPLLQQSIQAL